MSARCPICARPVAAARPGTAGTEPFCSTRCADIDLGRWLTSQYRIPGPAGDAEEADAEGAPLDRHDSLG